LYARRTDCDSVDIGSCKSTSICTNCDGTTLHMDHHKHSSRPGDAEHADDYEGSQDGHQSVFDTEEADQFDFGELEKADSEADEKEEMGQAKIPATTPGSFHSNVCAVIAADK